MALSDRHLWKHLLVQAGQLSVRTAAVSGDARTNTTSNHTNTNYRTPNRIDIVEHDLDLVDVNDGWAG